MSPILHKTTVGSKQALRLVRTVFPGSEAKARRFHVAGDRAEIRQRAAEAALEMVRRALANG
jgi:nicotinamide mononucleotide (NMN) deamidase PncC